MDAIYITVEDFGDMTFEEEMEELMKGEEDDETKQAYAQFLETLVAEFKSKSIDVVEFIETINLNKPVKTLTK